MDRTTAQRKMGEAYGSWYWARRHKYEQAIIVGHILEYRKYRVIFKTAPHEVNERGNTIYRDRDADRLVQFPKDGYVFGRPEDRYIFDFRVLSRANWKQFDTKQDASYFGVWVNLKERKTFTYCEGDRTLVVCPDDAHLKAELDNMVEFYGEAPPAWVAFGQDKSGQWTRTEIFDPRPEVV